MNEQTATPNFWRKPAVIGVTAGVAAALVVGGIATAVGIGIAQNNANSEVQPTSASTEPAQVPGDEAPTTQAPAAGGVAPSDADALRAAIETAVAAAGGTGATEIEVESGGYDVEVQRADGTEVAVFVALDGNAALRDEDDDDDDPLINLEQLPELVRISLDAAGGGLVEQISTDDDDDDFYEVEVRLEDGSEVEVDLDANLVVLEVVRD